MTEDFQPDANFRRTVDERTRQLRRRRRVIAATATSAAIALAVALPLALVSGGKQHATVNVVTPGTSVPSRPIAPTTAAVPTTTAGPPTTPPLSTTTVAAAHPTSTTVGGAPPTFSWSVLRSPDVGNGFRGELSCPSADFCAAAAFIGTHDGLTEFDGTSWSAPTLESAFGQSDLVEVSCSGPSSCLAVSGTGFYVTWNGTWWSDAAALPTGTTSAGTSALSCTSPAFCLLVDGTENGTTGVYRTQYSSWTGHGWTSPKALDNSDISSVSCLSSSYCLGTGQIKTISGPDNNSEADISLFWNGSTWSQPLDIGSPNSVGISTTGQLSCATPDFCMVVGGYHASGDEYATWNGTRWSNEKEDLVGTGIGATGFTAVSCPAATLCVATDSGSGTNGQPPSTNGPPVIAVWDSGRWSATRESALKSTSTPWGGDVSCPNDSYCVVLGSGVYLTGTQ
jgi:hypothetical protein